MEQIPHVFIGPVARIIAAAIRLELFDTAEVLADDQQFWSFMAQPLRPVTDNGGIERVLSAIV
jgi:hypothetical protein